MSNWNEYLLVFHSRAEIYAKWNSELKKFLESRNYEDYNETVQISTQRLKALRECVRDTQYDPQIVETIQRLENLEDSHLRANVEYHKSKISGIDCNFTDIEDIQAEIMEVIQDFSIDE
jgi:predicted site-specific integrase-resolvase